MWVGLCLVAALSSGCATRQVEPDLLAQAGLPRQVEWTSVPFHPQERYQCGPAALATALGWAGASVTPEALEPEVYLPGRKGSLQAELLAATPEQGRIGYVIQPGLLSLLQEVAAGHPVLVLQNLGLGWYPRWHYAVVVGYDLDKAEAILRSGREKRHRVSLSLLDRTWARGDRWGLVVLEPGELPEMAVPHTYLKAVVALQKAGHLDGAIASYRAAVARWPDNEVATAGLAEAVYSTGDHQQAAAILEEGLRRLPSSAVLHHNLAQVHRVQGRWEAAETHARRAVAEGGHFKAVSERLLEDIRRQRRIHAQR